MPPERSNNSSHLTLHYHLEGNNNDPGHADYRSDNPWAKMTALRELLFDRKSDESRRLNVIMREWPDKSVWRLDLAGAVTPTTLDNTARQLLEEIENRLGDLRPRDEIRVIFGEGVGIIREWHLVPN